MYVKIIQANTFSIQKVFTDFFLNKSLLKQYVLWFAKNLKWLGLFKKKIKNYFVMVQKYNNYMENNTSLIYWIKYKTFHLSDPYVYTHNMIMLCPTLYLPIFSLWFLNWNTAVFRQYIYVYIYILFRFLGYWSMYSYACNMYGATGMVVRSKTVLVKSAIYVETFIIHIYIYISTHIHKNV